ncbi:MAG: Phospho-N-acetylmuramoyl-pentapeptide-transferase [Bacilli bacterium]|nr:Phospho-N-acetylmuramoyl-pentapeptide-transferase [Bacilli bacterium]
MPNLVLISILAFVLVALLTPFLIQLLKHLGLTQPIRKELPPGIQAKIGTPLMTGLVFMIGVGIASWFYRDPLVYFLSIAFLLFGFIGFIDDFWKASRQDPGGVSGRTKLVLQFLFTGALLYYLHVQSYLSTTVPIYKHLSLDLSPWLFFLLAALFIVGSANAINFTDGLDGLLSVVAIPTYFFFFLISERGAVQAFCLVMIACLAGFLLYNAFPAKGFMGDTGSLAIGGSLAFLAILEQVEILIPLLFIIYFAEQLSVIIQVAYYKLTSSRIFRMSPIHYHYGLKYGWSENKIVLIFGIVSWVAALLSAAYVKGILSLV